MIKLINATKLNYDEVCKVINLIRRINNSCSEKIMKYDKVEIIEGHLVRVMPEMKISLKIVNLQNNSDDYDIYVLANSICEGLKEIYSHDTIHSDLKPSNIFLNDDDGCIILNDYCNNLLYKDSNEERCYKESDLCYCTYEELNGEELDEKSDSWSFGLIIYFLLSGGGNPFKGSNIFHTMKNINNIHYKPLKGVFEVEFNDFLLKLFKREKEERLNVDEIMIELKGIIII